MIYSLIYPLYYQIIQPSDVLLNSKEYGLLVYVLIVEVIALAGFFLFMVKKLFVIVENNSKVVNENTATMKKVSNDMEKLYTEIIKMNAKK